MKRFLSGLLCVCILLSGCAGDPPLPTQTDPPETQTQPSSPALPLLEQGITVGESGNLLYIPNEAVEDMICPEVRLYGNGLLLSAYIRNQYVLRHISLEDGALLNECAISASPGVKLRIGSGCIGLLDSGTNRLHLLGEDLVLTPEAQSQKTQSILEDALSERFGVKILIGEQCAAEYSHYNTYPLTDPGFVRDALDTPFTAKRAGWLCLRHELHGYARTNPSLLRNRLF